jgi:hypothetical protein
MIRELLTGKSVRWLFLMEASKYKLPNDGAQRLYDFYFITLAYGTDGPSDSYNEQIDDIAVSLTKQLAEDLHNVLVATVRLELTNIFEGIKKPIKESNKNYRIALWYIFFGSRALRKVFSSEKDYAMRSKGDTFVNSFLDLDEEFKGKYKDIPDKGILDPRVKMKTDYASKNNSVYAIQKELGWSDRDLLEFGIHMFTSLEWKSDYGGENYRLIAQAGLKYYTLRSVDRYLEWIDHVFDLEHNTGLALNKSYMYGDSGVDNALSWKFSNKDIRQYYYKVSSGLKYLVPYVLKWKYQIEDIPEDEELTKKKFRAKLLWTSLIRKFGDDAAIEYAVVGTPEWKAMKVSNATEIEKRFEGNIAVRLPGQEIPRKMGSYLAFMGYMLLYTEVEENAVVGIWEYVK